LVDDSQFVIRIKIQISLAIEVILDKYTKCAPISGFIFIYYITIVKPLKRRQTTTLGRSVLSGIMNPTKNGLATNTSQRLVGSLLSWVSTIGSMIEDTTKTAPSDERNRNIVGSET
jgi:hypothetical protein